MDEYTRVNYGPGCLYTTRILMFPLNTVIAQYITYYELMEYTNKHILFASRAHSQQKDGTWTNDYPFDDPNRQKRTYLVFI